MRHHRPGRIAAAFVLSLILFTATPSMAFFDSDFRWEGSPAERVVAKGVDIVIVRPLSYLRLAVGAVLVIPAALLAAPNGREGVSETFDIFVVQPANYAFDRELGEF
jgi:hypothetical protein